MTTTARRHIALLRQIADLAEQHHLPVPIIWRPGPGPTTLLLHRPWQGVGPRWAARLGLGDGVVQGASVHWRSEHVYLRAECVTPGQAERLAAEDGDL